MPPVGSPFHLHTYIPHVGNFWPFAARRVRQNFGYVPIYSGQNRGTAAPVQWRSISHGGSAAIGVNEGGSKKVVMCKKRNISQ